MLHSFTIRSNCLETISRSHSFSGHGIVLLWVSRFSGKCIVPEFRHTEACFFFRFGLHHVIPFVFADGSEIGVSLFSITGVMISFRVQAFLPLNSATLPHENSPNSSGKGFCQERCSSSCAFPNIVLFRCGIPVYLFA